MTSIHSIPSDILLEIIHKWLDVPSFCVAAYICSSWKKLFEKSFNELGRKHEIYGYKYLNLQRKPSYLDWATFNEQLDRYCVTLCQQGHGWGIITFSEKGAQLWKFTFSYLTNAPGDFISSTHRMLFAGSKKETVLFDGEGPTANLIFDVDNSITIQNVDDLIVEVSLQENQQIRALIKVPLLTWAFLVWNSVKYMFRTLLSKNEYRKAWVSSVGGDLPYDHLKDIKQYLNFFRKKKYRDDFLDELEEEERHQNSLLWSFDTK